MLTLRREQYFLSRMFRNILKTLVSVVKQPVFFFSSIFTSKLNVKTMIREEVAKVSFWCHLREQLLCRLCLTRLQGQERHVHLISFIKC